MRRIAVFGGTFDPIHNGHIKTSLAIQTALHFDSYYFLPCKIPVLKPNSQASSQQRIDMITLAIKNHPNLNLDLREINRNTPSYMVDTLKSFRQEYPDASITLVIGYDSLLSLPQWHQWEQLLELAHLLVIHRKDYSEKPVPEEMQKLLAKHLTKELKGLAGSIIVIDAGDYDISSTSIRNDLKQGRNVADKVPQEVVDYIKLNHLYQN